MPTIVYGQILCLFNDSLGSFLNKLLCFWVSKNFFLEGLTRSDLLFELFFSLYVMLFIIVVCELIQIPKMIFYAFMNLMFLCECFDKVEDAT